MTVTMGAKRALAETGGVPTQLPQTVVAVVGCEPRLGTRPVYAMLLLDITSDARFLASLTLGDTAGDTPGIAEQIHWGLLQPGY